jgi:hypothetical protein
MFNKSSRQDNTFSPDDLAHDHKRYIFTRVRRPQTDFAYANRGPVVMLFGCFAVLVSLDFGLQPVGATGAIRSLMTTPAARYRQS